MRRNFYKKQAKNLAKFSDTRSVRADALYIGIPKLVGGRKAGNSNMQKKIWHHAVHAVQVWRSATFLSRQLLGLNEASAS